MEAEKLSDIATNISFRQLLHDLRQYHRNQSLMDRLIKATRNTGLSLFEFPRNVQERKTTEGTR